MTPTTLSASSVATFELCEARYNATYIEGGREISGGAADLGTACHATLEHAVQTWVTHIPGAPSKPDEHFTLANLKKQFNNEAAAYSFSKDQVKAGHAMLKLWHDWHQENGWNEVLAVEVKETFTLKHPRLGEIPFTFICDRIDRIWDGRRDGDIEVIDYKSFARPMGAMDMETKIQVKGYALAMQIKYKEILTPENSIWVTYWLLRYGPIGMRFTREENLATYRYLQSIWERIDASDGTIETINPECRWCVRKSTCATLRKHVSAGGALGMHPAEQARTLAAVSSQLSALKAVQEELTELLGDHLDAEEVVEKDWDGVRVFIKPTNRREIDAERASKIIGPELMARYGTLGIGVIDEMIKNEPGLDAESKLELKRLIRNKTGSKLEVQITSPFAEEE